jgi:hypothetical protein
LRGQEPGWTNIYEWMVEFMPEVKILVCIRDLRAILSSMEKLNRKNKHLADLTANQAQRPDEHGNGPSPAFPTGLTALLSAAR